MMAGLSDQAMQPPGECKSVYHFWHGLAHRMGFGAEFPWPHLQALFDHRLSPAGKTFAEVVAAGGAPNVPYEERKYLTRGFATPSGKVEFYSSVLEQLGFDPLPYYREAPAPDQDYPLRIFVGVRDDEYFHTGQRFVPELRKRAPQPTAYLHPDDMAAHGLSRGDWIFVATRHGRVTMRAEGRAQMPRGLVRVPHGWWTPEISGDAGGLSGAWRFADAQLSDDEDPALMDLEQGVPHLKGLPSRVTALNAEEVRELEAIYGPSGDLPPGPRPKIAQRAELAAADFMFDPAIGDGVEFQATELAIYGKGTVS
jgi:anaerobic selenocysteine-containing dehydrogenase